MRERRGGNTIRVNPGSCNNKKEVIMESDNPFCDACKEKDCIIDSDGTCEMIRLYKGRAKAESKAWIEGTNATNRILKQAIRESLDILNDQLFILWIRGFIS